MSGQSVYGVYTPKKVTFAAFFHNFYPHHGGQDARPTIWNGLIKSLYIVFR